ncbi:MAG: hypothetical protein IT313_05630 [Anaerolineales bacterium]|nr:hypothetical protein [Anaerolineales bacterium]
MKLNWKWALGIVIVTALVVLPFVWQAFIPNTGSAMMHGYGYGMPMMGYGMMMPFGMWFMWLIPLGILILIALGIAWLAKQLTSKPL